MKIKLKMRSRVTDIIIKNNIIEYLSRFRVQEFNRENVIENLYIAV